MKNNCCILFTYEFPYRTSEPFLETEIKFLSKEFKKIFIFSVNIRNGEQATRDIPENVSSIPLNCPHSKIINILRGFFARCDKTTIDKSSFAKYLSCLYTLGRMKKISSKSIAKIKKNIKAYTSITIYSYWFNLCIPVIVLRDYFKSIKIIDCFTVSRAHGYDLYSERNKINFLPFQTDYLNEMDLVAPCSNDGTDYLKKKFQCTNIQTERLGTSDFGKENFEDKTIPIYDFCTCSRFRDIKRIPLFAEAFAKLVKDYPSVTWLCIGDGEEEPLLNKIIKENSLSNNVIRVGRLFNKEVLSLYQRVNIRYFVNISLYEGIPVSIMEALSFGIPCIATDVGGTREILDDSCGKVISPDLTVDTLYRVLKEELTIAKSEYIYKRKRARETWQEKCSAQKEYSEWAKIIAKKD